MNINNMYGSLSSPQIRIYENDKLVKAITKENVPKTFKERWLSRPWRPWVTTKTVIEYEPSRDVYEIKDNFGRDCLVMHPAMAVELRKTIFQKVIDQRRQ